MFLVTASGRCGVPVVCALLLTASPARANEGLAIPKQRPADPWRLDIGPVAGAMGFDGHLRDYRWDTNPAFLSGARAMIYHRRLGGGVRVWRAQTTQSTGIPGATESPRANLTGIDVVAEARLAGYRALELWGAAHGGRLHVGYDPDELTLDLGGSSGVVTVQYNAISEWDFGAGMALRADLTRQLALALQVDGDTFALDTAHRRGNEIIASRERFYTWSLRLQASWAVNLD